MNKNSLKQAPMGRAVPANRINSNAASPTPQPTGLELREALLKANSRLWDIRISAENVVSRLDGSGQEVAGPTGTPPDAAMPCVAELCGSLHCLLEQVEFAIQRISAHVG